MILVVNIIHKNLYVCMCFYICIEVYILKILLTLGLKKRLYISPLKKNYLRYIYTRKFTLLAVCHLNHSASSSHKNSHFKVQKSLGFFCKFIRLHNLSIINLKIESNILNISLCLYLEHEFAFRCSFCKNVSR